MAMVRVGGFSGDVARWYPSELAVSIGLGWLGAKRGQ